MWGEVISVHTTLGQAEDAAIARMDECMIALRRGVGWVLVDMYPPFRYANHSSEPNIAIGADGRVRALGDVAEGGECVLDYGRLHGL